MKPLRWIKSFKKELKPNFVEVEGRIFVTHSKNAGKKIRKQFEGQTPTTADENTSNHEHIELFQSENFEEQYRGNYQLAEVLRLVWKSKLEEMGKTNATLFVSSEFRVFFDDESGEVWKYSLAPTLRLWTHTGEDGDSFNEVYRPDQAHVDRVLWHEKEPRWFSLEEILEFVERSENDPIKQRVLAQLKSQPHHAWSRL